jgi:hypothetical protein
MDWKTISSFLGLVAIVAGASYYFLDLGNKTKVVEEKLAIVRSDLEKIKRLNQGPPGLKGERGPAGPRGEKGESGEKGSPGDPTDLDLIRKLIDEEITKNEYLERIKEQIVKILNEDAGVQAKYKNIISTKGADLELKEGQAKMVFGNQVSVGLDNAYTGYCYVRSSTDIEQKKGDIYPGNPWILKGSGGKVGIALISSTKNVSCKLKVYKVDNYQVK